MDEVEKQDVALENNESEGSSQDTESQETTESPELKSKVQELEAEVAKYRRIAERNAKKAKEKPAEESSRPDSLELVQKAFLRSADITNEDEVELALSTADKWGMSVDKLVDDEDFQIKLKKLRDKKANETAVSDVKGGTGGQGQAKNTVEYWKAKGVPPTREDVPDRKTRVKIIRSFMSDKGNSKKFYND